MIRDFTLSPPKFSRGCGHERTDLLPRVPDDEAESLRILRQRIISRALERESGRRSAANGSCREKQFLGRSALSAPAGHGRLRSSGKPSRRRPAPRRILAPEALWRLGTGTCRRCEMEERGLVRPGRLRNRPGSEVLKSATTLGSGSPPASRGTWNRRLILHDPPPRDRGRSACRTWNKV